MPRRLVFAIALVVLASAAHADWPAGGKYVMGAYNGTYGSRYVAFHDLPDGGHYVVAAGNGGLAIGVSAQRLTSSGDISPGWPLEGVSLDVVSGSPGEPYARGFAVDDSTCLWHAYYSNSAHLVQPDGVRRPSPLGSWSLGPFGSQQLDAARGEAGDSYLLVGARLRRFTRAGVQVPTWPTNGVLFGSDLVDVGVIPDGSGGVLWFSAYAQGAPAATRIDSTGVRHAGWASTGLPLSNDPADGSPDTYQRALLRPLVRSGGDHAFAAWTGPYSSSAKHVKLQRFSNSGTLASGWPAGALAIAEPDTNEGVTLVEDGAEGVYVLWYRDGLPVGTHVLPSGNIEGSPGTSLLPPGASFVRPTYRTVVPTPNPVRYVMADRTPDGRLMFAWDDGAIPGSPSIRVRWLLPDLTPDPSEPSDGLILEHAPQTTNHYIRTLRSVHSDGAGGAYLAWEVWQNDPPETNPGITEIWMRRALPGSLLDAPAQAATPRFQLAAPRPNPAHDAVTVEVTLSADGPVEVELVDVTGRIVTRRTVEGVGRREVRFHEAASAPPGLYFMRAHGRSGAISRRVVLAR